MITFITGVPGSGKSAYALTLMLKEIEQGRPLFVHGIPNLKIPHTMVVCGSLTCEVCPQPPVEPVPPKEPEHDSSDFLIKQYNVDFRNYNKTLAVYYSNKNRFDALPRADNWHLWAPDGALLFFDEVQNVYRPRSSSSKIPPSVSAFETHRHKGLDFFLVTQSPLLVDGNLRRLVGKHIHLRPTWAGRYQYEFPECNDNTKNTSSGVKSGYKLNPKVFDLYKSASIHTKQDKKVPFAVYLIGAVFFILLFFGYQLSSRFNSVSASASPVASPAPVTFPSSGSVDRGRFASMKLKEQELLKKKAVFLSQSKVKFLDRLMNEYRPRLSSFITHVSSAGLTASGVVEFYENNKLVELFSFLELHGLGVAVVEKPYGVDLVTDFDIYPVSAWHLPKPVQTLASNSQFKTRRD